MTARGASATATTTPAARQSAARQSAARPKGLAGTWRPINESPIATPTTTGTTARTTGQLACPGTTADADSAKPVLTLDRTTPNDERERGTPELDPDGSALVITWDGPSRGGLVDNLERADRPRRRAGSGTPRRAG